MNVKFCWPKQLAHSGKTLGPSSSSVQLAVKSFGLRLSVNIKYLDMCPVNDRIYSPAIFRPHYQEFRH